MPYVLEQSCQTANRDVDGNLEKEKLAAYVEVKEFSRQRFAVCVLPFALYYYIFSLLVFKITTGDMFSLFQAA